MKKYIVLSLAFLFLSPMLVQAQSSDKTQEIKETIGWLNQVGFKMLTNPNPKFVDRYNVTTSLDEQEYVIFKRVIVEDLTKIITERVKNVIQVDISTFNSIYIAWEKGQRFENEASVEVEHTVTVFNFDSQEDARRVLKAFSHLFTLLEDDFVLDDRVVDKNKF